MNQYIRFQMDISKNKPNTLRNRQAACPFCDRVGFTAMNKVLSDNGEQIWVENKFPTLEKCYQTVFVEHDSCTYDLSTYPKETLFQVLTLAMEKWFLLEQDPSYTSAVLLKNHGIQSGGSIYHPHMQIIGLEDIDYRDTLQAEWMEGITMEENEGLSFNMSSKPRSEFYELNISLDQIHWENRLHEGAPFFQRFCELIQVAARYILEELNPVMASYNLVFYAWKGQIIAKFIARGFGHGAVSSAYYLGYQISQLPSDIQQRADDIRARLANA